MTQAIVIAEFGQTLQIQLMDHDDTSDDEKLGRATVEISNIVRKGLLDTWLTLEDAKHGLVHLRLTWFQLSPSKMDLQAVLEETQHLRVTSMSTALLTVFVDSAKNLPQARSQSKPDPYLVLSVGKKTEQAPVQMRTDSPVWEQGFTFLVGNPDNDTLQLRIIDQKTEKEIGRFVYILSALLEKNNLEIVSQPFQLQKSGPESKITMSMTLRILKQASHIEGDSISTSKETSVVEGNMSRSSSVKSNVTSQISDSKDLSFPQGGTVEVVEEEVTPLAAYPISSMPSMDSTDSDSVVVHRIPSTTSSAGCAGLGRIQLTLRYSVQRQRLVVIVHKIMNIPLKDPSNIPDPYVKLYLLPGRSKESKRKTNVVKDNCNPVYDATFEYIISAAELMSSELEVTVATQKGFFSGGSPVIGMRKIMLMDKENVSEQGTTTWLDLYPEYDD